MRVFVVFFFMAGGIVAATGASSAQETVPAPPPHIDGGVSYEAGGPGGRIFHGGLLHHGYETGGVTSDCGCENGNCACHGSYKYPVPSQYSYSWPGIYSQQRMTQYISPWRYPDLNPIPERWKLDTRDDQSP